MIVLAIQKLYLRYRGYPGWVGTTPPRLSTVTYYSCSFNSVEGMNVRATFSYLLKYFVPRFTEATDIITLESVIFPMRFCVYLKEIIDSSSNNIFYIQIRNFTQQTILNQTLY